MATTSVSRPIGGNNEEEVGARVYKMRLKNTEYISEDGIGRVPAGGVVVVDERTATRWQQRGIATPAKDTDKTHKQERREQLLAELETLGDEDEEIRYGASIQREHLGLPKEMPKPSRRGRPAKSKESPTIEGAEVVNDLGDDDPDADDRD